MTTPMTQLPDGSGCFTATIMSHDEAMALPLKERPLNHRISSEMYHAVFEAIGEASMCWNPRPSSEVFASEQASDVAVRLCFKIAEELEKQRDALSTGDGMASLAPATGSASGPKFKVGDRVSVPVRFGETGTVKELKDGRYGVTFKNLEWTLWYDENELRHQDGPGFSWLR